MCHKILQHILGLMLQISLKDLGIFLLKVLGLDDLLL